MDTQAATLSSLHAIDYVVVVAYLVGTLLIGSYYSRYVSSASDLFLAGRSLPFWAIAMSVIVTDIGATNLTFGAGNAYTYGMSQINFDWIGSMPACIIAGLIFAPYFWRSGVYTIPEFLGRRYSLAVQRISAILWLAYLAINLSIMMHASAIILRAFVGVPYEWGLWGTALAVAFYTITGGLAAVVMTDALQMIVIFIGTAALLGLGLYEVGGWAGLTSKLAAMGRDTAQHMDLLLPADSEDTPLPWPAVVFGLGLVQSSAYFATNQAIIQRNLGARSEWDAMAGMILAGLLKFLMPILIIFPGLIARAMELPLEKADQAIPVMIRTLFPPGLTGLMVAAFLAAFMSGVSSYLNSVSTMFLADVYMPVYRAVTGERILDKHALWVGRGTTAVAIILACIFAPTFESNQTIYNLIQLIMSLFLGPTLAIILLGILWKRANRHGGLWGLSMGVGSALYLTMRGGPLFTSKEPFLYVSMWAFIVAVASTVLVSLLTPPEPESKIHNLVLSDLTKEDAT